MYFLSSHFDYSGFASRVHASLFLCLSSNGNRYLMIHYNLSVPPNDPKNLEKFSSDVAKWYLFVSNLTEEVWVELKKVFEADYEMKLHFQSKFSKESTTSAEPEESADSIESIKANKIKARQEAISVRRVLSGTNFINFHLLHPAFQLHALRRIKVFYEEKKHINAELEFLLPMSVSI